VQRAFHPTGHRRARKVCAASRERTQRPHAHASKDGAGRGARVARAMLWIRSEAQQEEPMATAQPHSAANRSKTARADGDVSVQLAVDGGGDKTVVERVLRRKVAWLRRHFPAIRSCRVAVDVPHRRPHRGRLHRVRIGIVLRGAASVSATRNPSLATHEDALVAIHDAFAAVHRELAERAHRHEERRRTG